MTELTQVWHHLRNQLGPYGHFTRIESAVGLGIPDVAYTLRGVSGWIENKMFDRGEDRCPSHLTLDQVTWAEVEERAGGRWHLFGRAGPAWLLYNVQGARALLEGETPLPTLRMTGRFPKLELLSVLAPQGLRAVVAAK